MRAFRDHGRVVGVVLNLAVWFAAGVLWFRTGAVDWFTVVVAMGAFAGLQWGQSKVIHVVLGSALLGLIYISLG